MIEERAAQMKHRALAHHRHRDRAGEVDPRADRGYGHEDQRQPGDLADSGRRLRQEAQRLQARELVDPDQVV